MDKVVIFYKECNIIIDEVREELKKNSLEYYEIPLNDLSINEFYTIIRHSGIIYNAPVIICHPINGELLIKLAIISYSKPRKIVFIIPPNPRHKIESIYVKILLYLFRTLLTFMENIGIKQLLVFTTPYEYLLLDNIIRKTRYVFYPTYKAEKIKFKDIMFHEKTIISFFKIKPEDLGIIKNTLNVLEELGFKPFFILNYDIEDLIETCLDDYRVICMYSSEYDEIINHSIIVIVKTTSPEANNVILKSIHYLKPVITTFEQGIAMYLQDTGLVFIQRKWDEETLADSIIEVMNNLNNIKKKALTVMIPSLKRDYGSHIIVKFLKSN